MSPNTNTIHHTAALVPPAWGHCVCYVHLVVQLLAADPTLVLTIIQHNSMVGMMQKEFASAEYEATRLKLVGVGSKEVKLTPMAMEMVFRELLGGWMDFLRGSESSDWPKPRTVHIDATCGGPSVDETKALLGADAKLLLLAPFGGMSLKANCTDYDFAAACEEIYADEARRKGRSKEEIALAIGAAFDGTDALTGQVVTHPGVPDMYDHERVSHAVGPRLAAYHILCGFQKVACRADGYILGTSPALEPVGVPYLREFYRERGQDVFAVGMQTHERVFAGQAEALTDAEVKQFLDTSKEKYGAKSALFISFGSLFFPVNQIPHVEALINVLLDVSPPLPFIFALGGAMATKSLPQALIDRVNTSGTGLVCQHWVEQRAILQHDAVGWFLTHGGYNSMTEAILEGVPMMVWPTAAEQPINAAYFSAEPNPIAFELLQIRRGGQLGPSLRHPTVGITGTLEDAKREFAEVFAKARGAEGERMRDNIRVLAGKVREARSGEALDEVRRLARL